jgi:hypothetical protein
MPPVRVRSKMDNLTVDDRTLAKGEVADCPQDRAKYLVERGLVELVDADDEDARAKRHAQPERTVSPGRAAAETAHKAKP